MTKPPWEFNIWLVIGTAVYYIHPCSGQRLIVDKTARVKVKQVRPPSTGLGDYAQHCGVGTSIGDIWRRVK